MFPLQYLTKQVIALREVNDSRLRIYESLENSIQDLEHEKHRLLVENNTDKKHIRKYVKLKKKVLILKLKVK